MNNDSSVHLQYWNGITWVPAGGPYTRENIAWMTLGGDDVNYRTVDGEGNVLTDKRLGRD